MREKNSYIYNELLVGQNESINLLADFDDAKDKVTIAGIPQKGLLLR
jgi:hypothetical protein